MVAARVDNNKLIARECAVFRTPWRVPSAKHFYGASSTYFLQQ